MFGRWFYLWCFSACAILLISILHNASIGSRQLHLLDSNRWPHFLIYAAVVAMPVGLWQRGSRIVLSLAPVLVSIALDFLASHPLFAAVRTQIISAELFGMAAGILLGLNLRVMRKAQDSLKSDPQISSNSPRAL